jgi:hypothetical protein
VLGAILLVVGIIIAIIGLVTIVGGGFLAGPATTSFGTMATGMFATFIGFSMAGTGTFLLYLSFLGSVASFYAEETKPAIRTVGEGAGEGLATGIRKGGGIRTEGERGGKDVVKVKCRECGYLDTEDATYCSNCGKKL